MYPPAPWRLTCQGWVSLFRVRGATTRPDGVYAAAFVDYRPDSPLVYSELLVARLVSGSRRTVEITDIWVDSVDSRDGGRELWAIPKDLCGFRVDARRTGPLTRTAWAAERDGEPLAAARFADLARAAPRLPFRGRTAQPGIDGGPPRTATLSGSARVLPCRGRWVLAADGPLGWLRGQRRLASARLLDVRMRFG